MPFTYNRNYCGSIQAAIFDWAGSTVDYGCQAPIKTFVAGFKKRGIEVSMATARIPMGTEKWQHIKEITSFDEVAREWQKVYSRPVTDRDIDEMFADFSELLMESIAEQSTLLPHVKETMEELTRRGIKIAANTGYFTEAAEVVRKGAAKEGYIPDFCTCASDVPKGRPAPWMIYRCMEQLGIYPPEAVVTVGDCPVDIQAALNAGTWAVGVVATGNQVGLEQQEAEQMDRQAYKEILATADASLRKEGAHYTIDTMAELPAVIDKINIRLAKGEKP